MVFKKGHTTNLGKKRSFTKEHKTNITLSHLGKHPSETTKRIMSEKHMGNKVNLGRHHSETTKEKMSEQRLKMFEDKTIEITGCVLKKGSEHWNWKGGITPLNRQLRNSSLYKIWREAVFLKDNFTCQNPNCEYCQNKIGVMLHPHHIKSFAEYPKLRFVISNGITYCAEFHINSKLLHKEICKEIQNE